MGLWPGDGVWPEWQGLGRLGWVGLGCEGEGRDWVYGLGGSERTWVAGFSGI